VVGGFAANEADGMRRGRRLQINSLPYPICQGQGLLRTVQSTKTRIGIPTMVAVRLWPTGRYRIAPPFPSSPRVAAHQTPLTQPPGRPIVLLLAC
jgi:hypothetical protein